MSSKVKSSEEQVTMSRSEYNAMIADTKSVHAENEELRKVVASNKLGSLVLLRNEKIEKYWDQQIAEGKATEDDRVVKYTAHSSFFLDLKFLSELQAEANASSLKRVQVDVSMNQSKFMSHDRLDPEFDANGEPNNCAPTFWLDGSSEFTIETLAQHILRDPDSAYDMSKGRKSNVSEGVAQRNVA